MDCDGAVKAEAPVARRAADVKRVDRGAIVLLNCWCEDQKDNSPARESAVERMLKRRRGEGFVGVPWLTYLQSL